MPTCGPVPQPSAWTEEVVRSDVVQSSGWSRS